MFDLAGNVWEWCLNEFSEPEKVELSGEEGRVLRGGSWYYDPDFCRAAWRYVFRPVNRDDDIGFRVCRGSPIDPPDAGSLDAEARGR